MHGTLKTRKENIYMQPEKVQSHVAQATPIVMPGRSAEFDFTQELEQLRQSPEWESGIARKMLICYPIFRSPCAG